MKLRNVSLGLILLTGALGAGCEPRSHENDGASAAAHDLAGTWRAKVQFKTGALAGVNDLEFMYVFNTGGTMTESSNYDGAPPVPPAYGIWKKVGPNQYQAKYQFFSTRPPAGVDTLTRGGGWTPSGSGNLVETITLSDDGKSYTSAIKYDAFDQAGKPAEGGGVGSVWAARPAF